MARNAIDTQWMAVGLHFVRFQCAAARRHLGSGSRAVNFAFLLFLMVTANARQVHSPRKLGDLSQRAAQSSVTRGWNGHLSAS